MFAGEFGQHVVRAPHPLIVVEGEKVLGSFSTLEAAEEFIAGRRRPSALVLRHTGQKWVMAEDPLADSLLHNSKSGSSREAGIQSPLVRNLTLISRIEETLQKYPDITYTAGLRRLEVPAQTRNGFRVWIRQQSRHYTVGFERWHKTFTNAESAFTCFMFGLSGACRLRALSCGGVDYKWQVQHRLGERWITDSETGMFLYPFWGKRRERFLQNNIIKAA
jgi:hypothetical protein